MTKLKVLAALFAGVLAVPALADETEGLVLAFDRLDGIIVLADKTVWQMSENITIPADLASGDRVLIDFASDGESGVTTITELLRLAKALPKGTDGGS